MAKSGSARINSNIGSIGVLGADQGADNNEKSTRSRIGKGSAATMASTKSTQEARTGTSTIITSRPKMGQNFQIDFNPTVLHIPHQTQRNRGGLKGRIGGGGGGGSGGDGDTQCRDGGSLAVSSSEESGADSGGETSWGDSVYNAVELAEKSGAAAAAAAAASNTTAGSVELAALPAELLWKVLGFLSLFEVIQIRSSSKSLKEAADVVLGLPISWAHIEAYAVGKFLSLCFSSSSFSFFQVFLLYFIKRCGNCWGLHFYMFLSNFIC